ncbi:P-loop containing nucleoside triphosphate hydrolase protein [Schizophyllum commune H4-8]|uniref:DNA 3'-5' helicase n=1 Tax=Schizophyllum commune (strain H4-8 / FGSC 9210) TaxID=578458 RepID=D8QLQ1_SCHCM|nr:P-loop containing nucleoside triphosphate hydrolase protein [Schizophyllum commune H4-8]KAI5884996.1 P-loop containing nucleoside triphosphate hydrolase protein [Schizophyllum commune H4-8]
MAPTQPPSSAHRAERLQTQAAADPPPTHGPMTQTQLAELRERIRDQQLHGLDPRDFQLRLAQAQEEGQDAVCQAPTGSGKTLVASAPYVLEKNAGRTTLMVSPLIALMNEMVIPLMRLQAKSFEKDYGVSATALNSSKSSVDIKGTSQLKRILNGDFCVVLLSPEMLASKPFTDCVLRNQRFTSRVYSVIVDEAHCISFWGAEFRKCYGSIGFIRAFLPRDTPIIALSATLTSRVIRTVVDTLQLSRSPPRPYLHLNIGNDRPNVSLIVRAMHHPMNTYNDLDFVIPANVSRAEDIPKTWIYADNITTGQEIIQHLHSLLPEHLHSAVRPFNAVQSEGYRDLAMDLFRQGIIRILVCTDAAGMGCNMPDIIWIIQWRTTEKLSMFMQRAGRAVRASLAGYAVLLVESAAYNKVIAVEADEADDRATANARRVVKPPTLSTKETRVYAKAHGRGRGAHNGKDSFPLSTWTQLPIEPDDETEGMYHFVQTKGCRRLVLNEVFNNPSPARPTVPCCDICNPELLDLVRARKKASGVAAEPKLAYEASKSAELWHAIDDWREDMCERGHAECSMGPECFLPTYIVDKMAILKRDNMQQHARKLLKSQWLFWDKFGQQLVDYVVDQSSHHHDDDASLPIPPTQIPSADLSACTEPVDQPPQSTVSAPDALRSGRGGTAPANTRKRAGTKTANDPAKPKRKRGAPKPREVPHVAGEGVSASEAASSTKRGRMRGGPIDDMRGTKKQKVAEEGAAPSRAVGGRMNEKVLQPPTAATSNAQQESLAGGPPTARPIAPAPDRCSTGAQAAMHDGLARGPPPTAFRDTHQHHNSSVLVSNATRATVPRICVPDEKLTRPLLGNKAQRRP